LGYRHDEGLFMAGDTGLVFVTEELLRGEDKCVVLRGAQRLPQCRRLARTA
jgi:hypothetical protein